jgi:hypothetical protein
MRLRRSLSVALIAASCAGSAFAQAINTAPPPVVHTPPPVVNPSMPVCGPNTAASGTPCTIPSTTVPTIVPIPLPVPQPPPPVLGVTPRMPALAGGAPSAGMVGAEKVLSYFQRGTSNVDTSKAFGFVIMPRSAVTDSEKNVQMQFCRIMLASLDFVGAEEAARTTALVTYWPLTAEPSRLQIEGAFATQDCPRLIGWYDHRLARQVAARADVVGLGGPFLITWPSEGPAGDTARDPLIVDFAVADHAHAKKALAYWFGELRQKPKLWTNRIREGTIRAELADAINDTAGVMIAVLAGKWESVTVVSATP